MNIDIRPLTPDLLGDYLDFFDNVAFADNPECALANAGFPRFRRIF